MKLYKCLYIFFILSIFKILKMKHNGKSVFLPTKIQFKDYLNYYQGMQHFFPINHFWKLQITEYSIILITFNDFILYIMWKKFINVFRLFVFVFIHILLHIFPLWSCWIFYVRGHIYSRVVWIWQPITFVVEHLRVFKALTTYCNWNQIRYI